MRQSLAAIVGEAGGAALMESEGALRWLTGEAEDTELVGFPESAESAESAALDALTAEAELLRRRAMLITLRLELGKAKAVDVLLHTTFLPTLTDDRAGVWLKGALDKAATVVKDLGSSPVPRKEFEEQVQNLRIVIQSLFEMGVSFFVKDFAAANTMPTALVGAARVLYGDIMGVFVDVAGVYGVAGSLDMKVKKPSGAGMVTLLDSAVERLNTIHRKLVEIIDIIAKSIEAVRTHWVTELMKWGDFSLEVAMNLVLPLRELIAAKVINPAVFLAAMDAKYPGMKTAALDVAGDAVELNRMAPETASVVWDLLDAATQGAFNGAKFVDSLLHVTPEEAVLITSRMLHIALTSSNPWMLVVPYVMKKVMALPKMLGGAYDLLSAPERIEYGLTKLDPAKYRKARAQLADPAVQAKLLEFGQAALLLYKYWDVIMEKADHTGGHVAGAKSLAAMRELLK